jgi:hypothetical protein
MKQEFKKGDRVLVRRTDLQPWVPAKFFEEDGEHFLATRDDGRGGPYYQCRHIDDFRTGDKVQVRDCVTKEWEDGIYAVHVPKSTYPHYVFDKDMDSLTGYNGYTYCRWHPSMRWADKEEPLTLEQRVEALERKLNDQ